MRLGISSAAAPGASLEALLHACAHRGLHVLELRAGDGHGVRVDDEAGAAEAARRARATGVTLAGLRLEEGDDARQLARCTRALGAPAIVAGGASVAERIDRARAIVAAGGAAHVATDGPPLRWLDPVARAALPCVWEVRAADGVITEDVDAVLRRADVRGILQPGGGPETAMHEGRGVGPFMARLALAAYRGTVVVAPSSPRFRIAWETWLGRRGGWGCGGKSGTELTALDVNGAA